MRLLDRYVLKIFLSAAAVFVFTFLALFLVIDFASKVQRFFQIPDTNVPLFIGKYYAARLPLFLHFTLPMVTVFAAAFTMIKLTKNNEVLPIVASGTSLRRVARPFIAVALMCGAANAALEEAVLPDLSETLSRTDEVLVNQKMSYGLNAYGSEGTHVTVHTYDHLHRVMHKVHAVRINAEGRKILTIVAARGEWVEETRQWIFFDGHIEPCDERGEPLLVLSKEGRPVAKRDPIGPEGYAIEGDLSPRDLRHGASVLGEFSRLGDLLAQIRRFPKVRSLQVNLYSRFSFPASGLVLLLVGLPFVAATTSKSFFRVISLCFLVVCAFYAVHLACLDLGYRGRLHPAVAAWGAVGLFGPGGIVLFARMKT